MAYELKDGGGTIFKNKYKEEGDLKPDKKGTIKWRGEVIEVAIWIKQGAAGEFESVKLQEPRQKPDRVPTSRKSDNITSGPQPIARRASADMDDEIPF
jgi:hypothetical protein